MIGRRLATVVGIAGVTLAVAAGTAFADDCANVSRAPAPCGMTCTSSVIDGNWVWLPSIGEPFPAWGFAPPGGPDSVAINLPGANGNYTNGKVDDLLGVAAQNSPALCANPNQTTGAHGIVTGACHQ